jgi:hypothetical protein
MIREFVEGMHKVGEAMAAAISAQVTKDAQLRRTAEEQTRIQSKIDKHPEMAPR